MDLQRNVYNETLHLWLFMSAMVAVMVMMMASWLVSLLDYQVTHGFEFVGVIVIWLLLVRQRHIKSYVVRISWGFIAMLCVKAFTAAMAG